MGTCQGLERGTLLDGWFLCALGGFFFSWGFFFLFSPSPCVGLGILVTEHDHLYVCLAGGSFGHLAGLVFGDSFLGGHSAYFSGSTP